MHEERTDEIRALTLELYQQGKVEEVIQKLLEAGKLVEDDYDLQTMLGACLSKLNRNDEAVEAFKRALSLRPSIAQAFYNLGAQYVKMGKKDDGRLLIMEALQCDPKHAGAAGLLEKIGTEKEGEAHVIMEWERSSGAKDAGDVLPTQPSSTPPPVSGARPSEQSSPDTKPPAPSQAPAYPRSYTRPEEPKSSSSAPLIIISLLVILALAAGGVWYFMFRVSAPEKTVLNMIDAIDKKDVTALISVMAPPDFAALGIPANMMPAGGKDELLKQIAEGMIREDSIKNTKIISCKIEGKKATVSCKSQINDNGTVTDKDIDFTVIQGDDGVWRVDMVATSMNMMKSGKRL